MGTMWILIFSLLSAHVSLGNAACLPPNERFDCHPEPGPSQERCEARGCCWDLAKRDLPSVPTCSYPANYGGYKTKNVTKSNDGMVALLQRTFPSAYPNDVPLLKAEVIYVSDQIVRIKISDPVSARYETPYPKIQQLNESISNLRYDVSFNTNQSGFRVARKEGGIDIFNSLNVGAFTFADQFIEISTTLPSSGGKLYGVGEHRANLSLSLDWQRYTLYNKDIGPIENANLYGSHPFYMGRDSSGKFYGVYLHNSNAMEILTSPLPSLTFRTIGGILDFYFFVGPTPDEVVQQYTSIIGRPFLPPYWGLGFHLCKFGYDSTNGTREVWARTRALNIPYDVQWNDIDMLDQRNMFILADSYKDIAEFVEEVHDAKMRYVIIMDPGVSAGEPAGTYPPFDLGLEMDVFVKNKSGDVLIGKAWNPVSTAWPDFTHPRAQEYWNKLTSDFHDKVPFDGLWIDVNEPSNFLWDELQGSIYGCPEDNLENPPYVPSLVGDTLTSGTFCMNAKQYAGNHYDVHNLYSISEAETVNNALRFLGKRPFVISRSTSPGSGRYTGHWSGDDNAQWHDMAMSIPVLLAFNMFGIPFMGTDICGFRGDTNRALCNRWVQLGAFYPFARNHNDLGPIDQDPAVFDEETIASIQKTLLTRYTLLPFLYTLLYQAHVTGSSVARPVFFEFPDDVNTLDIQTSFFWGSALLIAPVLDENSTSVDVYLPEGRWYDFYNGSEWNSPGQTYVLNAPYDTVPLVIRGGSILPLQPGVFTTEESREGGMFIVASAGPDGGAEGMLYWDDGEIIDPIENDNYGLVEYVLKGNTLSHTVTHWTHTGAVPSIHAITIAGISGNITELTINGVNDGWVWGYDGQKILIVSLLIPINSNITIEWN